MASKFAGCWRQFLNRSTLVWHLAKQSNNFFHTKEKVSWSVEGNGTWRQKARSTESKIGQSKRPRFVSSSTFESKIYYEKSGIDFGHSNTAGNLPAIVCSLDVTALRLDRQLRSLLVDNNIIYIRQTRQNAIQGFLAVINQG